MLHLDPGLGKTVASLSAIEQLLYDYYAVGGVLVMAPLRVIQAVWKQEAAKWSHTRNLTFSYITGDVNSRIRGMCAKADVYLVNYENLTWLQAEVEHRFLSRGKYPPWDMAIFDEVSKMKGTRIRQGVKRGIAALKLMMYCTRRVGLTGSPASNGMLDLFGQYLVVDAGEALGTSFSAYRSTYFYLSEAYSTKWKPFEQSKEQITEKIAPITLAMKARDYLDMPEEIENDIMIEFPPQLRAQYDRIEKEMLIELASGNDVEIFNRASLTNRCLQFCGGGVYLNPGAPDWEEIHKIKLEAFNDLIDELNGQPALIFYQYQHEAKRILKAHPDAKWLSSKTPAGEFNQAIMDWNAGKLQKIVCHPASMGHGVDRLQHGCHNVIWYGIPWSYDYYFQSNSRIARQGQDSPTVMIHRLLIPDTVDEIVRLSLEYKQETEEEVRDLLMAYAQRKLAA